MEPLQLPKDNKCELSEMVTQVVQQEVDSQPKVIQQEITSELESIQPEVVREAHPKTVVLLPEHLDLEVEQS